MKQHAETDETPFRFRWHRRPNWDFTVYDARLGRFLVGQVSPVDRHFSRQACWSWHIPLAPMSASHDRSSANTPREAARRLEAAFSDVVRSVQRLAMRTEDEVIFRAVLGQPHTAALDHALAVERGEHVRPISPTDKAGWDRWLAEERRRGNRNWISPEDMREWFGPEPHSTRTAEADKAGCG